MKAAGRALAVACVIVPLTTLSPGQSPGGNDRQGRRDSTERSAVDVVVDDLGIVYGDAVGFFTAPLSFDAQDWNRAAVGAVAVGAIMAMDEPLNSLLLAYPPPEVLTKPFEWAQEWGRLRTMQVASLGLYIGGLAAGSDPLRVTGRLMGEALLLSGIPAITLQYVLGRSRPYSGEGAWDYNFFEWGNEFQALPSGHTTVAFAISTVLAKRIDRTWASVPLYTMAGLTALSLGWSNQHWPSDLLVGAAIGYLAGSFVVEREEERSASSGNDEGDHSSRFGVGIGPGGITMRYLIF